VFNYLNDLYISINSLAYTCVTFILSWIDIGFIGVKYKLRSTEVPLQLVSCTLITYDV
jgi:hypothetical protein